MRIFLVRWQIEPGDEAAFETSWREDFDPVAPGLIYECLTKPDASAPHRYSNMPLLDPRFSTYLTIGFWNDARSFDTATQPHQVRSRYAFRTGTLDRLTLMPVIEREGSEQAAVQDLFE